MSFQALVCQHSFAVQVRDMVLTLFHNSDICREIFFTIGLDDKLYHYIDGPGSLFTQRMWNSIPMRPYGNMIHLTEYPYVHKDGFGHREPAFLNTYLVSASTNLVSVNSKNTAAV